MINKLKYCVIALLIFTHILHAEPVHLNIVTEQLPPFQMRIVDGIGGYVTEIITASLAQTSFSYDISIYPWARAFNLDLHKKNTCVYSIARTQEREALFQWTRSVATTNTSLGQSRMGNTGYAWDFQQIPGGARRSFFDG